MNDTYPTPEELAHWREVAQAAARPDFRQTWPGLLNAVFTPALILRLLALAEHAGVMREALKLYIDDCDCERSRDHNFVGHWHEPNCIGNNARTALAQCEQGEATK